MLINCIQRQVKCLKYGEFHDQFLAFPHPPPAPKSTMSMYSYDSEFFIRRQQKKSPLNSNYFHKKAHDFP